MKKTIIVLLLMVSFVSAGNVSNYANEVSGDTVSEQCEILSAMASFNNFNDYFFNCIVLGTDTTNRATEADVAGIFDSTNSVQDLKMSMITKETNLSVERLLFSFDTIISILFLLLEVILIIFYLIQLIFIIFIPYIYVKMLTWIHGMVIRKRYIALMKKKRENYTIVIKRRMT